MCGSIGKARTLHFKAFGFQVIVVIQRTRSIRMDVGGPEGGTNPNLKPLRHRVFPGLLLADQ